MSSLDGNGRWAERASITLTASALGFLTAWWLVKVSKAGGQTVTVAQRAASARQQELCLGNEPRADPYDPLPRSNYLSWDDYFLYVAFLSAQRSKDPNKQVGACIVSRDKIIVGIGYNGFPRGCSDAKLPWAKRSRTNNLLDTKYPYVCHAEMNAVLNTNKATLAGCSMYVTMFPCNECAKLIIQAGIAEVVYFEGKDKGFSPKPSSPAKGGIRPEEAYAASKRLLAMAGVRLRQHRVALPFLLPLPGRHKPHSSS